MPSKTRSFAGFSTRYIYAYNSTIAGIGGLQGGGWVKQTIDAVGRFTVDNQEFNAPAPPAAPGWADRRISTRCN